MKKFIFLLLSILLVLNQKTFSCDVCKITEISQSPYTDGVLNPTAIKYSPNGKCLVVGNAGDNTISIYSVNPNTCELTLMGSPIPTGGSNLASLAFSPSGTCLAVLFQNSANIQLFSFNQETCQATPIGGLIPSGGVGPTSITYSPNGRCAVVTNQTPNGVPFAGSISIFSVNPDTCGLDLIDIVTTGVFNPTGAAYSPNGKCLAVSNFSINAAGTISIFSVNENTCGITPVSTFIPTGDNNPTFISYSPNGRCLAVANSNLLSVTDPGSVSIFGVNPDNSCEVTQIGGTVATGGEKPLSIAFSPDSRCLGVANIFSDTITIFSVSPTCGLTMNVPPTAVGSFPRMESYSPENTCFAVINSFFNPLQGQPTPPGGGSINIFMTNFSPAPIITSISNCPFLTIMGTAQMDSTISVFQDGVAIGTTVTNSFGNFVFSDPFVLPGAHTYRVQATNTAGCVSALSNTVTTDIFLRDALTKAICVKYGCSL